jgi:hypothetical protein
MRIIPVTTPYVIFEAETDREITTVCHFENRGVERSLLDLRRRGVSWDGCFALGFKDPTCRWSKSGQSWVVVADLN